MFDQITLFDKPVSNFFQLKKPAKNIAGLMARISLLPDIKEAIEYLFEYLNSHPEMPTEEVLQTKILILQVVKQLPEDLKKKYSLRFSKLPSQFQDLSPDKKMQQLLNQILDLKLEKLKSHSLNSDLSMNSDTREKLSYLNANISQIYAKIKQMKLIFKRIENSGFSKEQLAELNQAYGEKSRWFLIELENKKTNLLSLFEKQIELFAAKACSGSNSKPVFKLKEEVQQYQKLAKELFLSAKGFQKIRGQLSLIWLSLKELEKKRKQEKKELHDKSNIIEEQLNHISEEKVKDEKFQEKVKGLEKSLKKSNLLKKDRERLKKKLGEIEQPVLKEKEELMTFLQEVNQSEIGNESLLEKTLFFEEKIAFFPEHLIHPLELLLTIDEFLLRIIKNQTVPQLVRKFIKDRMGDVKKFQAKSNLDFEQSFILTQKLDVLKKCLDSIK